MKIYRWDAIALAVALVVMAGVIVALPLHVSFVLRGATGFGVSLLLFLAYLVVRKPDVVIDTEELLQRTAQHATAIAGIARELGSSKATNAQQARLVEISERIAHVATKCFTRDLESIRVHVQRLERVARDFATILSVLTGEVKLRRSEMATQVEKIENEKIPGVLGTLEDIEVAIDEVQAHRWQAAESDLEILTHLTELSSRAEQAGKLLEKIISRRRSG